MFTFDDIFLRSLFCVYRLLRNADFAAVSCICHYRPCCKTLSYPWTVLIHRFIHLNVLIHPMHHWNVLIHRCMHFYVLIHPMHDWTVVIHHCVMSKSIFECSNSSLCPVEFSNTTLCTFECSNTVYHCLPFECCNTSLCAFECSNTSLCTLNVLIHPSLHLNVLTHPCLCTFECSKF